MTHTVTLVADHKGFTKPRANGDEYMVDAVIDITAYVQNGITVTAASLGLSQITQVMVTGAEQLTHSAHAVISTTGAYESVSSFKLVLVDGPTQTAGTGDEGTVRVRVFGLL